MYLFDREISFTVENDLTIYLWQKSPDIKWNFPHSTILPNCLARLDASVLHRQQIPLSFRFGEKDSRTFLLQIKQRNNNGGNTGKFSDKKLCW